MKQKYNIELDEEELFLIIYCIISKKNNEYINSSKKKDLNKLIRKLSNLFYDDKNWFKK